MDTHIIPLGTGSALPKLGRHFSSMALVREDTMLLFDCGEGTQLRLLAADLRRTRIACIFITHLHGDHIFGLLGLLTTLALIGYNKALRIVGPRGVEAFIDSMPGRKKRDELPFELTIQEVQESFSGGVLVEEETWLVRGEPLSHSVFTVGYRFEEKPIPGNLDVEKARVLGIEDHADYRRLKAGEAVTTPDGTQVDPEDVISAPTPGKCFAYVTDTEPCAGGRRLANNANLVYHEATFMDVDQKKADETRHATARGAGEVARDAGARRLIIGHFSLRYEDTQKIVEEARIAFQNTEAAEELKRYLL